MFCPQHRTQTAEMASTPKLVLVPRLVELLADPSRVATLPKDAIPQLRGELAKLDTMLLARLMTPAIGANENDRLLDASEAAAKLGTSEDWVYRHAKSLPFAIRVGKKSLRFSEAGISRYIRQHTK